MPELPEVETSCRGISPHISGHSVSSVTIRQKKLRYPVPDELESEITNQRLNDITRRAKYMLFHFPNGTMIMHLGMSGSVRILENPTEAQKHDHVDIVFDNQKTLRFHDPRRFGMVLWTTQPPEQHALLTKLGPEPLTDTFTSDYLFKQSRKRKTTTKQFIMDNAVVVGVGNIYASESLFLSSIRPGRAAMRLTRKDCETLTQNIKTVLSDAIKQGGTTLRDFTNSEGKPGYFAQSLNVYGRAGDECPRCGNTIKAKVIGQRNTFYCPGCQR